MEHTSDQELKIFVANIVFIRKHFGLTKTKMAKMMGISISSLNKIEQGNFPVRLGVRVFARIYHNFGIPPYRLFLSPLDWNQKTGQS